MIKKIYNASVVTLRDGKLESVFMAEVQDGIIYRSNWSTCTGYDGTARYDQHVRDIKPFLTFIVVMDNGQTYLNAVRGKVPTIKNGAIV